MARPISLLLALAAVVAALTVAACGGSGNEDAGTLLRQTFASQSQYRSGQLAVTLDANLQGLQAGGPASVRLTGPFQSVGQGQLPKFDLTLAVSSGGQSFTAGGVSTGDRGFVRFQGQPYALSPQLFAQLQRSYRQAQAESGRQRSARPSLGALGIDPATWLRDPRKVGEEDVAGTTTIHLASGVDVPRLLGDVNRLLGRANATGAGQGRVPQQLTPQQQRQLEQAVQSASIDVYTGKDDKLLRKLDLNLSLRRTPQSRGGTLHLAVQLSQVNQDVGVTPPANARPLTELISQLQGGGGGGGGVAPQQGSAPNSRYLQCVQRAGQDLAKAQACAKLL